jgi:hypothetical protein
MGDKIVVTIGEQNFMPHRYQGFRVGPFSVETQLLEGETYLDAYNRVWAALQPTMFKAFMDARNMYAERFLAKN